ncbi:MAG: hypothetical protein ACE365_05885 [Gammaproteobacteria bacterium]
MSEQKKASISLCCWQDARKAVSKVNPSFAKAIDAVSPSSALKLWRVRYPFGAEIIQNGILQLPNKQGNIVSINDDSIDKSLRESLYMPTGMPMGIVLDKSIEIHHQLNENIVPFWLKTTGQIFALSTSLQPLGTSGNTGSMWQITSGARSLIMLPKISQSGGYKRLKRQFNIKSAMPITLQEQWNLFRDLTNSPGFKTDWHCEVLFFSREWIENINAKDGAWDQLRLYLLDTAWKDTAFIREERVLDYMFSCGLLNKNVRPNPYLATVTKNLYSIALGAYPAFKVATNEVAAPIHEIQKIFLYLYELRFSPTMMHLSLFHQKQCPSIYYSLEYPLLSSFLPKSRKAANKLNDLREIKYIQNVTKAFIMEDAFSMKDTLIYKKIKRAFFNYYHSDEDALGETNFSFHLPKIDSDIKNEMEKYPEYPFCHTSPFLRGCIRISDED